jgi:hypothetical protein
MADEARRPSDAIEATLTDVIAVLDQAGIAYTLIGGLATGYRSRPRYTKDIDLILDIPQIALPSILDALGGLGFEFDKRQVIEEFTRHHMAVLWRDGVRVDWLKPLLPAYRHVLDRSELEPGPTGSIRVATTEGLILLKLFAFRLQDQTDVEALVAANRDAIDIDWIQTEWETVFEPADPRWQWFLALLAADGKAPGTAGC